MLFVQYRVNTEISYTLSCICFLFSNGWKYKYRKNGEFFASSQCISRNVDLLRLHHHLFGNAIQMLLWKMKERRESAVASKIHVSLCVDVIRFRTWFHRIQVSWLREQIPLPHFLNETSVPCFFHLYDIVSRLKKYGYLFNFKNLKEKKKKDCRNCKY